VENKIFKIKLFIYLFDNFIKLNLIYFISTEKTRLVLIIYLNMNKKSRKN